MIHSEFTFPYVCRCFLFRPCCRNKTLYSGHHKVLCSTRPTHLILPDFIILILFYEVKNLWSSYLCKLISMRTVRGCKTKRKTKKKQWKEDEKKEVKREKDSKWKYRNRQAEGRYLVVLYQRSTFLCHPLYIYIYI